MPAQRARTWIFLRGLLREQAHWGSFTSEFSAAFPGDRVVAFDLPGCGARRHEQAPWTMRQTMAAVRAEALRSDVVAPVHLMAISLGGLVALEWMRRHPDEIAAAVLLGVSAGRLCAPWQRMQPRAFVRLFRAALERDVVARERRVLGVVSARAERAAAALPLWTAVGRERPVTPATALRQLTAAALYRAPRAAPGIRALVLAGAADRLVAPACARAVATWLGAERHEHPAAGHDLPMDDAPWVIDRVRRFVAPG